MRTLILIAAIQVSIAKPLSETINDYWNRYKSDFNKSFESAHDEAFRKDVFWESMKTISRHNYAFRRGRSPFKMGINQFTDKTFEEFSKMYTLNETMKMKTKNEIKGIEFNPEGLFGQEFDEENDFNAPSMFDWRERGAVTRVKDQKSCGACYAVSTIGALESHLFIKTGKLIELSDQEIIDCPVKFHSWGCSGGIAFRVYDYVKHNGGLSSAADYPFDGKVEQCRVNRKRVAIDVKGYGFVSSENNKKILMEAISTIGPVVVAMDIDHETFMRYSGGIYYDEKCTGKVNHGALIVGYKTSDGDGEGYWIIKNSFGETWGESGYLRIALDRDNDCDVKTAPLYPILN